MLRCTRLASTLLFAAGFLSACANGMTQPDGTPPGTVVLATEPIEAVTRNASTGIENRRRGVIRSQAEWEAFWNELTRNISPPEPAPSIDFTRRMVIAAAMGTRSSGGFAIDITSVRAAGEDLFVDVLETSPGPACAVTMALTAPVTAVSVERRTGETRFVERAETRNCS
ncbi:MAG: protease complex subunit PrcB family protein [Gemmatimonadota bacterium]